jgi:hypothetical protein
MSRAGCRRLTAARGNPSCQQPSRRFVSWQRQLGLLSVDSATWPSTWADFHETYTTLIGANQLSAFVDTWSDSAVGAIMRPIRIDVARLSRYFRSLSDDPDEARQHVRRIERVLYLFSVSSSASGYRQGHHEILAPLYYVAVQGGCEFGLGMDVREAIAFFLLHALINGTVVGDFFLTDQSLCRTATVCEKSARILKVVDAELSRQMEMNGVETILFAFAWITVLFSQTYRLPQLLRLWDFLFSEVDKLEQNLTCLIVAHLVTLRGRLIGKNFTQMLKEFNGLELESEADVLSTRMRMGRRA